MIPYYIGDVMQAISQHRKPSKTHNPGFSSTDLFLETFPSSNCAACCSCCFASSHSRLLQRAQECHVSRLHNVEQIIDLILLTTF